MAPNASLPAEKEHLLVYLTRPPPREPVLDTVQTVEDMAQRVEFAKNIEANTGLLKYKLTVVEASAILSLPQAALRAMEGDCPEVTPNQFFANFRELLFSCMCSFILSFKTRREHVLLIPTDTLCAS